MKWITRSHVHVDRVACPWLITRFIDSDAEFIFVPASKVMVTAKELGATPFDAPGAELNHEGPLCTFTVMVKRYDLKDRALHMLAEIVNAADTNSMEENPYAHGLEAISVGYSLRFPNDMENHSRQFEVYDALYAWCRLKVGVA